VVKGGTLADRPTILSERAISFGPFRLLPTQRLLVEDGKPVRLGSRALEILIALVARAGDLVGKDELMARVWPDTVVEEANLKVHVGALRRALGDGAGGKRYVVTVPGRGYSFVAPVTFEPVAVAPEPARPIRPAHNLPTLLTRLTGRRDVVGKILRLLSRHRLVTIVGPGGIGKTAVALAVAEELTTVYDDGVWLVDLVQAGNGHLVPSALATVLGVEIRSDDPLTSLISVLRDKRMLIVLDSCEHVIEDAAHLASSLLRHTPKIQILATSREPLRIEGEQAHRLAPLAIPPASPSLTAAEAQDFPSVQLFIERATAIADGPAFDDADIALIADICRRLDGIPLAIELAAPHASVLGLQDLSARLDDGLRILDRGRRMGLGRHRTMRATLDWSYGLIDPAERELFQRLAIFAGGFTLQAVEAVVGSLTRTEADIAEQVFDLVTKSLVVAEVQGAEPRYRLLETTRRYALERLAETEDCQAITRRHAEYYRDLIAASAREAGAARSGNNYATYSSELGNVRAALDWAFGPSGDPELAVALTTAAIPFWSELSLFPECRQRTERAIAILRPDRGSRSEVQLHAGLAAALFHTKGPVPETCDAWSKALDIAKRHDDQEYQVRATWGLWSCRLSSGEFRIALTLAEDFHKLAAGGDNGIDPLIADWLIGSTLHHLGDQPGARRHLERFRDRYAAPVYESNIAHFQLDPRIASLGVLARVFWVQGFPDRALRMAEENVAAAQRRGHTVTMLFALLWAGQVALLAGNLTEAAHYAALLLHHSSGHAMAVWSAWARGLNGMLQLQQGDIAGGVPILRGALDELKDVRSASRFPVLCGPLAIGLAQGGQQAVGLSTIDEAIEQCELNSESWNIAELLRIKGCLLRMQSPADATRRAKDYFDRSLQLARFQGALAWELRTAHSLACLHRDQGQRRIGRDLLAEVYSRFSEGTETADLLAARRLLDALS